MNINEITNKVNGLLKDLTWNDKRASSELSVRRVRDYIAKGFIEPNKLGKELDFGDKNLKQLLTIRILQSQGMSEKFIKDKVFLEENELDSFLKTNKIKITTEERSANSALLALREIQDRGKKNADNIFQDCIKNNSEIKNKSFIGSYGQDSRSKNNVYSLSAISNEEKKEDSVKKLNTYNLGKVLITVLDVVKEEEVEQLKKQFENILLGDNNDRG